MLLDELYAQYEIDERRAKFDDRQEGFRREFERLARSERAAGSGRQTVRGWLGTVARSARSVAWTVLNRTPSDAPA